MIKIMLNYKPFFDLRKLGFFPEIRFQFFYSSAHSSISDTFLHTEKVLKMQKPNVYGTEGAKIVENGTFSNNKPHCSIQILVEI